MYLELSNVFRSFRRFCNSRVTSTLSSCPETASSGTDWELDDCSKFVRGFPSSRSSSWTGARPDPVPFASRVNRDGKRAADGASGADGPDGVDGRDRKGEMVLSASMQTSVLDTDDASEVTVALARPAFGLYDF